MTLLHSTTTLTLYFILPYGSTCSCSTSLYLILLHSTIALLHSTWLARLHSTMALLHSTMALLNSSKVPHSTCNWLILHFTIWLYLFLFYFTLRHSTTALLHSTWPYLTLLDSTSLYNCSSSLYHVSTLLYFILTRLYFTELHCISFYQGTTSLHLTLLHSSIVTLLDSIMALPHHTRLYSLFCQGSTLLDSILHFTMALCYSTMVLFTL